jgi:putative FmdB family regulatory protein
MPLKEYGCSQCDTTTEKLMIRTDDLPPVCPKCGAEMHELMSAPAIAKLATPAYGVM